MMRTASPWVALWLAACGPAVAPSRAPAPRRVDTATAPEHAIDLRDDRPADVGPRGERAELHDGALSVTRASGTRTFAADDLHAPPGDRSVHGIWPRAVQFLDDGTLLVGADDGTVTALGPVGPRWATGLRGGITGFVRVGGHAAAITTRRGVIALVDANGTIAWERALAAERLGPPVVARDAAGSVRAILAASARGVFAISPSGGVLFSHAMPLLAQRGGEPTNDDSVWPPRPRAWEHDCIDAAEPARGHDATDRCAATSISVDGDEIRVGDALRFRLGEPHPPIADLAPVFPLTFERVLDGAVVSVLPDGPDGVLALVCHWTRDYGYYSDRRQRELRHHCELVDLHGSDVRRTALPDEGARPEVLIPGGPPERGDRVFDGMTRGPSGAPWIFGRRLATSALECEDGACAAPQGVGFVLEVNRGKVQERRELVTLLEPNVTGNPLVGAAGILCAGTDCAVPVGSRHSAIDAPRDEVGSMALVDGQVMATTRSGKLQRLDPRAPLDEIGFEDVRTPEGAFLADVAGSGSSDVWADVLRDHGLYHFDGSRWRDVATPVLPGPLYVRAPNDAWSGRMHWDGTRWSIVAGAPFATAALLRTPDDVWLGADDGLWHGVAPGPAPVDVPAPAAHAGPRGAPMRLEPAAPEPALRAERVATKPDVPTATPMWQLVPIVDPDPNDREVVAQSSVDFAPHALARDGAALRPVREIPAAAWCALAPAPDGGVWMAGGLSPGPSGEGILFHARGPLGARGAERHRAAATLLAVAAAGAEEAWAVGAGGTIVHVRDGVAQAFSLASGEWLRAVVSTPDGVWIGGDGGTLLHYEGEKLHAVAHPLGARASFTHLTAVGDAVWASGPSGTVKIRRAP